jgi:hypothetical protein
MYFLFWFHIILAYYSSPTPAKHLLPQQKAHISHVPMLNTPRQAHAQGSPYKCMPPAYSNIFIGIFGKQSRANKGENMSV